MYVILSKSDIVHMLTMFYYIKGPFTRSFLRIRFLLVPKIEWCEHIENELPTHGSVIWKKRMEIQHALISSDTLLER